MILANGKKEPEFVFFPCVLDGQIVGSPLHAIDLVIDETARRADTSDNRVGPDELLHTGIARQVVFHQRRFYMNGPFMASEPSQQEPSSSWRLTKTGERRIAWRLLADRISLLDPQGVERAFREVTKLRGCETAESYPYSSSRMMGLGRDVQIIPNESFPQQPLPRTQVAWRPINDPVFIASRAKHVSRCPEWTEDSYKPHLPDIIADVYADRYQRPVIHMRRSDIHAGGKTTCLGDTLILAHHQSVVSPLKDPPFLLISRFDMKSESWLSTVQIPMPQDDDYLLLSYSLANDARDVEWILIPAITVRPDKQQIHRPHLYGQSRLVDLEPPSR
jgi:hypothetical protein